VNSAKQFMEPITIIGDSVGEQKYIGGMMFEHGKNMPTIRREN
jgi:hypothetical protein